MPIRRALPRHLLASLLLGTLAVAPLANWRTALADDSTGAFCSRVSPGVDAGAVGDPELIELSGLAASHDHPGVLWAHNDSGDTARLFAMSDAGAPLGRFDVAGATAVDWEDIAVGRGPDAGASYIYVGDIGDNAASRDHVTVYRIPEPADAPSGVDGTLASAVAIDLVYPGGPSDAESLFIDPQTGDLFIVTKALSGASVVLRAAAADLTAASTVTMTQVAAIQIADTGAYDSSAALALPSTMATAADISPDGSTILLRTYQQVLAFDRAPGQSVGEAMSGTPCEAMQVAEPQGEAIAFSASGDAYFTSGEVQLAIQMGARAATDPLPLERFAIAPATPVTDPPTSAPTTAPATTAPVTEAPSTTSVSTTAASTTSVPTASAAPAGTTGGQDHSWRVLLVVGGVAVGLGAVAVAIARRRR
ncbi:MAG: hypothetical protein JWM34_5223 [Ilumatobacteraceae bacterium]|nr:hypothetical protein [Ilumatobacteraceae bacterium]